MPEEPKASITPTKKEYVVERWWHRLLKTIKYITTLIIIFGALFVVIYEAKYYTYSYSFEPDYAKSKGKEFNCNAYDYTDFVCGDLNTGEKFMAKYIAAAKNKAIPDPWAVVAERTVSGDVVYRMFDGTKVQFPGNMTPEEVEGILRKQYSQLKPRFGGIPVEKKKKAIGEWDVVSIEPTDRKIAEFIIQKYQIKYKRQYNLNTNKLTSGLGVISLIAITWYIVALVLYKIILYIVHGHTRVRKPTPNP